MTARCLSPDCLDGPPIDDQPAPRHTRDDLTLCARCSGQLTRRLAELPAREDAVRRVLGGVVGSGGRPQGKPGSRLPISPAAHDHLQAMQAVLVSWTRMVCEERELRGPDRSTVAILSAWLLAQIDWLVRHPAAGDLSVEVRELERDAHLIAQDRPGWHQLPVPCPGCGALSLGRWDGDDHVGCSECGDVWGESDYRRLVLVVQAEESVTGREVAAMLGVEPATVRQWVKRGRLAPVGRIDGEAHYRVADVRAMEGEAS